MKTNESLNVEEPIISSASAEKGRLDTPELACSGIVSRMRRYLNCATIIAIGGCSNVQCCENLLEDDHSLDAPYAPNDQVWPELSAKLNEMSSAELIQLMDDLFGVKVFSGEDVHNTSKEIFSVSNLNGESENKIRLIRQIGALLKYPPTVRKRLKNTNLINFKSCTLNGIPIEGTGKYQRVIICSDSIQAFFHEVFHALDDMDGFCLDNPTWTALNVNGKDYYLSTSGLQAAKDGVLENASIVGTASKYGRSCVDEDQAEVASYLFVPELASKMLQRQNNDLILRKKIESLTGTSVDIFGDVQYFHPWRGGYKRAEYFPVWSCDIDENCLSFRFDSEVCNCNVETDYEYWNTIVRGQMPLFGNTKDEQIKWVMGQ